MRMSVFAAALCILAGASVPAQATETITSACVTTSGTPYKVKTDGAPPAACSAGEQRIRLLEVIDTVTYRKVRGSSGGGDVVLARFGGSTNPEVELGVRSVPSTRSCELYVRINPVRHPLYVDLSTGITRLSSQYPEIILLQVRATSIKRDRGGKTILLSGSGGIYDFSELWLDGDVLDTEDRFCFGAATIQHDDLEQITAK